MRRTCKYRYHCGKPRRVTSANHGFEVDQWVKFGGINGMTQLNGQYGKITAVYHRYVYQ
jgi:hypothetical protein